MALFVKSYKNRLVKSVLFQHENVIAVQYRALTHLKALASIGKSEGFLSPKKNHRKLNHRTTALF
jgi:hypothetical protein